MPLADVERYDAGVVAGLPAFEQPGFEGEVAVPAHQVLVALAGDVRHFDAVESAGIAPSLDVHGHAQDAAALDLLCVGRRWSKAAERQRTGSAHAECGHRREILAPVHPAFLEVVGNRLCLRMKGSVRQHEFDHRTLSFEHPPVCRAAQTRWPASTGRMIVRVQTGKCSGFRSSCAVFRRTVLPEVGRFLLSGLRCHRRDPGRQSSA